ncbi:MAG: hypothetical protein Q4F84_09125 [Fibrobacter sp.]|nr:hypothetical protein [Fibrobacter sp.]
MLRYQRLGYEDMKDMRAGWKNIQDRIPEMGKLCPNITNGLQTDIVYCYDILRYEHLQTNHPFENIRIYAEKGVELGKEYFYGKWRDSYQKFLDTPGLTRFSREECRRVTPWIVPLTYSILLSLLLNDTKSTLSFAEYIGDNLYSDVCDYYGASILPQYVAYWNVLGYGIKNNTLIGCEEQKSIIENSSRRIYKMLLTCLESLFSRNVDLFQTTFRKYMELFNKQVTDPKNKRSKWSYFYMSLDGSILWNYANSILNANMPEFSEEIMDRILTASSCGLQK